MTNHPNRYGFTIVELLIVIVVIAILAAITIVTYNSIQTRASTAQQISAMRQYANAFSAYTTDKGMYPYTGASPINSVACVWAPQANCSGDGNYNATPTTQLATAIAPYLSSTINYSQRVVVNYSSFTSPNYTGVYFYGESPANIACPRDISGLKFLNETFDPTLTRCRYTFIVSP